MTPGTLPIEREGITHKVHIDGMVGYITANMDEDGELQEVFIHGFGVTGTTLQGWADTLAILLSMFLQEGGSLSRLAHKFVHKKFEPNGPTDNPDIPECASVPEYVLRWLAFRFGDEDLKAALDLADQEETLP